MFSNEYEVYATGGSGCRGDCTPPTMGENSGGRTRIINGLKINENNCDCVVQYFQKLPTQILEVGKKNTFEATVYENVGPKKLSTFSTSYWCF